jgi:hypothetical protein
MKNLVRFAVAGALMAGFATAQAQSLPSSGSSDLWLFVSDSSAGTSFAEDTGLSLSTILPSSSLAANSTLATTVGANFSVGASSALTAYINSANSAGQTLNWAVLGGQDPNSTKNGKIEPQGAALLLGSAPISSGANIEQMTVGNLGTALLAFTSDISYLTTNGYATGGSVFTWANGSNGGNVWGAGGASANGGSTNFYNQGNGASQAGIALGSSTGLYGFTGNGGTGQLESYVLGDNLTLSSTGALSISSATSPVPLPAAVWLFGSGLLGLLGVGRRRAATQA